MKNAYALALLGLLLLPVLSAAGQTNAVGSLPGVLLTVLDGVKAKTKVDVLLPTTLPKNLSNAKHANVDKATADEYAISLYYELDAGNAGFAASFHATHDPRHSPLKLRDVREIKLASGITGFFRPVSCGGSCAPADLWWKRGATLYQIQLKLPSTLGEKNQQQIIESVANSAILAGPR